MLLASTLRPYFKPPSLTIEPCDLQGESQWRIASGHYTICSLVEQERPVHSSVDLPGGMVNSNDDTGGAVPNEGKMSNNGYRKHSPSREDIDIETSEFTV